MWIRFTRDEVLGVLHFLGVLMLGIAIAMFGPLVTGLVFGEWGPVSDYAVGIALSAFVGLTLMRAKPRPDELNHRQALLIAALGWFVAALLGAVPLALSGNYGSYLDGLFDAVSGLTTSGLTLAQDLDHMAHAHNMWRHLTHGIGGQGIIVAAISLAIGLKGGAFSLYLAEGRDERILPNVMHTARFIWFVTALWVLLGTVVLTFVNVFRNMALSRGFLHALWATLACYDTGGFGPMSQNSLYYHSPAFELVTVLLMVAGTVNFNLHADVWRGDRTEVFRNLEARTLAGNVILLTALTAIGLSMGTVYSGAWEVVRKGAYHVMSANSGTGHQSIYASQWSELGPAAFFSVILAMAFGGMVSSTAGGIKSLRIGLILKGVVLEVHRALSPSSAVVSSKYHHIKDRILTPELVAGALMVFTLYLVTYMTGGLIGAAFGYPLGDALFESVSAAANVGLSTGITNPTMPTALKWLYIIEMWAGRLEFLTALALIAAIALSVAPKVRRS